RLIRFSFANRRPLGERGPISSGAELRPRPRADRRPPVSRAHHAVVAIVLAVVLSTARAEEPLVVGEQGAGRVVVPTNQVLTPAGRLVIFPGRPVDLALLGDGKTVAIKNLRDLVVLDATTGTILQTLRLPAGGHAVSGLA